MKPIRFTAPRLIFLGASAALAILIYNTWSFCCGRCSAASFLNPGPAGFLLLGLTFLFALALLLLRRRRRRTEAKRHCRCGQPLGRMWHYCTRCGVRLAA
ncbi:MAG: hypothetical protein WDA20_12535 [Desulfuromonadales bacterium]|jgi:hypothetical protein